MSRRQLKKISGYDETEELKKAMGINDNDINQAKPTKLSGNRKKKTSGGFASAFLDLDEADDVDVDDDDDVDENSDKQPVESVAVQHTPKKNKKRKNKKKKNSKKDGFDEILENYGFKNQEISPQIVSDMNISPRL